MRINTAEAVGCIVVLCIALNTFFVDTTNPLNDAVLGVALGIPLILAFRLRIRDLVQRPVLPFALLAITYAISAFVTAENQGVKHTVQIAFLLLTYLVIKRFAAALFEGIWFSVGILVFSAAMLVLALAYGPTQQFQHVVGTVLPKNAFGGTFFALMLLQILLLTHRFPKWAVATVLVGCLILGIFSLAVDHRSMIAFIALFTISFFILRYMSVKKPLVIAGFLAVFAVNFLAVWASVSHNSLYRDGILSLQQYSQRRIESGRDEIWPVMVNELMDSPIFGRGAGVTAPTLTGLDLSAHNLYLQVGVQTGFIGLGILVWLLFEVIRSVNQSPLKLDVASVSVAGVLAISFENSFEVLLIQNNMPIAILSWIFLGLANSNPQETN